MPYGWPRGRRHRRARREIPGIDQHLQRPAGASSRIMSPSRMRASAPPSAASGVTWIAAGTLPDAPDMRPSVSSATLWPRSWSRPSVGVSLCSSGMPLAFGPWKRTTAMKSLVEPPGAEGVAELLLRVEDHRRRLDDLVLRLHRRDLDDGAAEIAVEQLQPALAPRTARAGGSIARRGSPSAPSAQATSPSSRERRLPEGSRERPCPTPSSRPRAGGRRRGGRGSGTACRRPGGTGSRRPSRSDRRARAAARPRRGRRSRPR